MRSRHLILLALLAAPLLAVALLPHAASDAASGPTQFAVRAPTPTPMAAVPHTGPGEIAAVPIDADGQGPPVAVTPQTPAPAPDNASLRVIALTTSGSRIDFLQGNGCTLGVEFLDLDAPRRDAFWQFVSAGIESLPEEDLLVED